MWVRPKWNLAMASALQDATSIRRSKDAKVNEKLREPGNRAV